LVVVGRKGLARERDAADAVGGARNGFVHAQLAPIIDGLAAVVVERDVEVAERRVRAERPLVALPFADLGAVGQRLRLGVPAGKEQLADLRERFERRGVVGILRAAGPEAVDVELQPLVRDAAEDHRADAAVPDRQRLLPLRRGLVVPERELRRSVGGGVER
jgi:hypothetical protein